MRRITTLAAASCAAAFAAMLLPTTAWAHVSVSAVDATQGAETTLTIKVPNESESATTTGIKVQLPQDHPLASVSIQPKSGWSYTVKKTTLSTPLTTDDGPVTTVISEIDWTVTAGNRGIKAGEFESFVLSAGPLPDVSTIAFKTLQTYSDGSVVSWIEEPAPGSTVEPEHAAPVLTLSPASAEGDKAGATAPTASAAKTDKSVRPLAISALAVAVVALIAAGGGAVRSRGGKG
jgi:uncharacterized protein